MPHQLDNVSFDGRQVIASLATFSVQLPVELSLSKVDDHTVQATIDLTPFRPKWMPSFLAMLLGIRQATWNLDTGSLNVR